MKDIRKRVVDEFFKQVKIDSLAFKEKNMLDYIEKRVKPMHVEINLLTYELKEVGMGSANLIVKIPANSKTPKKSLFFDSHLDTVEPGIGIEPVIEDNIIKSKGDTILGADDKAASSAMVIAIEEIVNSGIEHGDLYFIFSTAEEVGLMGVKHLDFSKIKADYGFVLDSHGAVGGVIISAPFHYQYEIKIRGKASHAGIAPEKGISAIKIGAKIITDLPQGKISTDTVANVGIVEGGKANNIVPDECIIRGEYRSLDFNDIKTIHQKVQMIVDKHKGEALGVEIEQKEEYKGFSFDTDSDIIRFVNKAITDLGLEPQHEKTGGGSNTNIYNQQGIIAVTLASGMMNVHSTDEYIPIDDLENLVKLIVKLAENT